MFHHWRLKQRLFTDTVFFKTHSLDGSACAQGFANESFFVTAYPMKLKGMAGDTFGQFIWDYGTPTELVMNGSKEQTEPRSGMMKRIRKYDIWHLVTEPHRHNQNRVEGAIRKLKSKWFRAMTRKEDPQFLWDFGIRWCSDKLNRTANNVQSLRDEHHLKRSQEKCPTFLDFTFYNYAWVHENAGLGEQTLCW